MQSSSKNLPLLVLALLAAGITIASKAEAVVRLTPKDGYGHSTESLFDPITDFLAKMTLHEDLVFRTVKTSTGSDFLTYICPTTYRCQDKASCLAQTEYWNCELVYREDSARTCKRYKRSQIAQHIAQFVVTEGLEDAVTAPIHWLQVGIGAVISNATVIPDAMDTRDQIRESDCRFLEDMAMGSQLEDDRVHMRQEYSKGDIRMLISAFAPGYFLQNSDNANNTNQVRPRQTIIEQLPAVPVETQTAQTAAVERSGDAFFDTDLPYLQKNSTTSQFIGARGKRISYIQLRVNNPTGVIVIVPGQGDPAIKYAELVYDWRDKWQNGGYDLFILDHRGQGQSERELTNRQKGHVEAFSDYVDDMQTFVDNIVQVKNYSTSAVIADSMGGGITAGFLQREPRTFSRNIFVSPMFGINLGKFVPKGLGEAYAKMTTNLKMATQYAPGEDNYNPNELLKDSDDTSSPERFATQRRLYYLYPELALGGVTNGWLNESLRFTDQLQQDTQFIQMPTLVFQAGSDNIVSKPAQTQICTKFAGLCELVRIEGSKHDILIEKDQYRNQLMTKMNEFLAK